MTALEFGRGWRDDHDRERTLLWLSDVGWVLWDDGINVHVIRRDVRDERTVRAWLLGWETMVDEPNGGRWAEDRVAWSHIPSPSCLICQGEGWYCGMEGMSVRCCCGEP